MKLSLSTAVLLLLSPCIVIGADAPSCADWHAEILSLQGQVELKRAGNEQWAPVSIDERLCVGDSLRVHEYARAALALPGETLIRLDERTTVTFAQPADEKLTWLEVLNGLIHAISRHPRALQVTTPFANAGVEGTEFSVHVDDSATDVAVFEGSVALTNATGTVDIGASHQSSATRERVEAPREIGDRQDLLSWADYYPQLVDAELPGADEPIPDDESAARQHARRAQRRLNLGRVEAAMADVEAALMLDATQPAALALLALLELRHGNPSAAHDAIDRALASDRNSVEVLLARSYLEQDLFDLEAARASLFEAVALGGSNSLAWSRLAEIQVALGDVPTGLRSAQRALDLDPSSMLAEAVRAFGALTAGDIDQATTFFRRSVELDSAAPLPRLGLGIAHIRDGSFEAGRKRIEEAVLLGVNDGLVRSYMAKAYFDELRLDLSESQLGVAKSLAPMDPTAWLYEAVFKQSANQPVAALADLDRAASLNDDRDTYRSRLMLDEDLGTRSAALGRIYRALGFEQLALLKGWRSTIIDPTEYAAHQLLADSYSALPRHQIARVSELYQSQLMRPLQVAPIAPQLAEANLFVLGLAGPTDLAREDVTSIFPGEGLKLQGSAITAANDTQGGHFVLSGLRDKVAFNVGTFRYQTDGFRENNDLDHEISSAFVQVRPSNELSLQAELRSARTKKGDLRLLFDPGNFSRTLRQRDDADTLRLGLAASVGGNSTLLASLVREEAVALFSSGPALGGSTERVSHIAHLQYVRKRPRWTLIAGTRLLDGDQTTSSSGLMPPLMQLSTAVQDEALAFESYYAYTHARLADGLLLTLGASADHLDGQSIRDRRVNPKLGLLWQPTGDTLIRVSAFRTLQAPLLSKYIVQPNLEPTHVAGFNQFFFGSEGERSETYGLGIHHRLNDTVRIGAELSTRDLDVPIGFANAPAEPQRRTYFPADEFYGRSYVYWSPRAQLALTAGIEHTDFDNHQNAFAEGFTRLRTSRLPLGARLFAPGGLNAGLTATYIDQRGTFAVGPTSVVRGADRFWVVDAMLGFRLPNRRGSIELNVKNLLNESFNFQDIDPEDPRVFPERFVALRFSLRH